MHDAPMYGFSAGNSDKSFGIALTEDGTPPVRAGASGTNQSPTVFYEEPFASFDAEYSGQFNITNDGEIAETLKVKTTSAVGIGGHRTIVRRLTPLECERLMGWPDNYTAHGITDEGKHVDIANTNRYRICGNGIVANVTEWIGNRLLTITSDDYVDETKTNSSSRSPTATSQT